MPADAFNKASPSYCDSLMPARRSALHWSWPNCTKLAEAREGGCIGFTDGDEHHIKVRDHGRQRPTRHDEQQVKLNFEMVGDEVEQRIDHQIARCHQGQHANAIRPQAMPPYAKSTFEIALGTPGYIDVHVWRFVPSSFRLILRDLNEIGQTGLKEQTFHDSVGNEFYVTLSSTGPGCPVDRLSLARATMTEHATIPV